MADRSTVKRRTPCLGSQDRPDRQAKLLIPDRPPSYPEEQVPHARREGQVTSQAASIIRKISSTAASGSAASRASE